MCLERVAAVDVRDRAMTSSVPTIFATDAGGRRLPWWFKMMAKGVLTSHPDDVLTIAGFDVVLRRR